MELRNTEIVNAKVVFKSWLIVVLENELLNSMLMADIVCFHIQVHDLFQFYVVWILRLINFMIELTDYMMLLYLQGIKLNMLFVQSLIPK